MPNEGAEIFWKELEKKAEDPRARSPATELSVKLKIKKIEKILRTLDKLNPVL
ncbi:MAG: hypothetical protein PHW46_03095 [Candidatus Omnitrophica bacterium]|nr:hypothetical protein [Candidatus Omnitrophota bacterium]